MLKNKNLLSIICFILLFLICLMPSIHMAIVLSKRIQLSLAVFFLSFSVLCILFCFYKKFPRVVGCIFGLLALGAVIELQFISYFGGAINANALSLLNESNVSEVFDLLPMLSAWFYISLLFVLLLALFNLIYPFDIKKIKLKILFFVNFFLFIFVFSFLQVNIYLFNQIVNNLSFSDSFKDPFAFSDLPDRLAIRGAYPTGVPFIIYDYYQQRRELVNAAESIENFRFNAVRNSNNEASKRQIYVLVIGESSTYGHWGINGYERETSPRLSARDDLLSYNYMFTYHGLTRLAVPVIISRKSPALRSSVFNEASIVTYFKEIGFETAWISLQMKYGYHDSPISIHAFEADNVLFLNPADYRFNGKRDYEALPEVQRLIESSDRDLFIVIHTLGSHFRYYDRYDQENAVFLPDHRTGYRESLLNPADKELLINSYDNSILATDAFLDDLIELLAAQQESADSWMFYISDHGQALFDDCSGKAGLGFSSPAVHHIPAFFWASPGYIGFNETKVENMAENNSRILSSTMVFDTLVSLGGGSIPNGDRKLDLTRLDIASPPADIQAITLDACIQGENETKEDEVSFDFGL